MIEDFGTTIDEHYQDLLATILGHGKEKKDRTGTGTKSIFGYSIRHDMTRGFPLLTTKKMAYSTIFFQKRWCSLRSGTAKEISAWPQLSQVNETYKETLHPR